MRKYDTGQVYLYAGNIHTRRHRAPYITADNETKLRITVSPLDLSDPKPPNGVPSFIEPVPWGEMNKFLERSRPWEPYGGLDPQIPELSTNTNRYNRWHEADGVFIHLDLTVEAFLGKKKPRPNRDNLDLVCLYRSRCQWYITSWTRPGGELMPHLNAFIIDPEPLLPDRLTTGEVCTAFSLLTQSRFGDGYNSHRYIPLTIFSASDRNLRILQC